MREIVVIGSGAWPCWPNPIADTDFVCSHETTQWYINERITPWERAPKASYYSITPNKEFFRLIHRTKSRNYEFELDWGDNTKELIRLVKADPETSRNKISDDFMMYLPSERILYNLKLTHRYLKNTPHFLKTMEHIKYMRGELSAMVELSPEWKEFFTERERLTLDYGRPNLKKTKEEFFTPDVPYLYDHDYLHSLVSNCILMETPAYQKFAIDGQEVLSSRTKFFLLPENVRLDAVIQEACVLALERSLIPFQKLGSHEYTFPVNNKDIFLLALEKVCTSITSGWFREYAWENYTQAVETFDRYYSDFANTIHKEIILFPSEIIYHKKAN